MPIFLDSNGNQIHLGNRLGAGGEGEVFALRGRSDVVAKIYRSPSGNRTAKLEAMIANPPLDPTLPSGHRSICWPQSLILRQRRCVGFLMHRVDFATNVPIFRLYNPQDRRVAARGFNWGYLLRTAANIAGVVDAVHSRGYVIGDLNESNFLVSERTLITLVDCDSMQVTRKTGGGVFRCIVGKVEFTAPELQKTNLGEVDRNTFHDNFALGVMIFMLLMEGIHPYAGVWLGRGESPPLDVRIVDGLCPYGGSTHVVPMPSAVPYALIPTTVKALFDRCFRVGTRTPYARPTPQEWQDTLRRVEESLGSCLLNVQHVYPRHLSNCPWCERTRLLAGYDPYPPPIVQQPLPAASISTGGGAPTPLRVSGPPTARRFKNPSTSRRPMLIVAVLVIAGYLVLIAGHQTRQQLQTVEIPVEIPVETPAGTTKEVETNVRDQATENAIVADYAARIRTLVERNIKLRDPVEGSPQAEFSVVLGSGGEVLSISLVRGSGNASFDVAVEDAIRHSSPLPVPMSAPDLVEKVFRLFTLKVSHTPSANPLSRTEDTARGHMAGTSDSGGVPRDETLDREIIADYAMQIRAAVERNIKLSEYIEASLRAKYEVVLDARGKVLRVALTDSSGSHAFDNAVERAILQSSPLPVPINYPDLLEREFRRLTLSFVHKGQQPSNSARTAPSGLTKSPTQRSQPATPPVNATSSARSPPEPVSEPSPNTEERNPLHPFYRR